jgi:hypothetical protein
MKLVICPHCELELDDLQQLDLKKIRNVLNYMNKFGLQSFFGEL